MASYRRFALGVSVLLGMALLLAAMSGCTTPTVKQDPRRLEGGWTVVSVRNGADLSPVLASAAAPTARFAATTLTGSGGVNSYSAEYATTGADSITITLGPVTKKAGAPKLMTQENAYLSALADARHYRVTPDSLELLDGSETAIVSYVHSVPLALQDNLWTCQNYNNGQEAVVSLVGSSTITIRFGADGRLSGSGGVNQYATSYRASGSTMKIDPITATKIAGPAQLIAQEKAYLHALQHTERFEIDGDQLILRSNAIGRVATFVLAKP